MTNNAQETLQRLCNIPIETLGLSEDALRVLKWEGMTTVADCARYYVNDAHLLARMAQSNALMLLMYSEVEPKMKEHNYWTHVMDKNIWDAFRSSGNRPRKMIVQWQGQEQDLYHIPVEQLGLSEEVTYAIEVFKLKTIGQWLDEYDHLFTTYYVYGNDGFIPDDLYYMMHGELLDKMKQQDYWTVVAENFNLDW